MAVTTAVMLGYFIFLLIILVSGRRKDIRARQLLTDLATFIFMVWTARMFFVGRSEGDTLMLFVWASIAFMNWMVVRFLKNQIEK